MQACAGVSITRGLAATHPQASADGNLLKNADFVHFASGAPDQWTKEPWAKVQVKLTTEVHAGKPVLEFVPPGDAIGTLYQLIPLKAGLVKEGDGLTGRVWIKAEPGELIDLVFYVKVLNAAGQEIKATAKATQTGDGAWHQAEVIWRRQDDIKEVAEAKFYVWAEPTASKPFQISDASVTYTPAAKPAGAAKKP